MRATPCLVVGETERLEEPRAAAELHGPRVPDSERRERDHPHPKGRLGLGPFGVAVADAATAAGAARHGEGVRFDQMEKFDIAIVGSVAVAREGARLGKGGGFADLEMGIFV